MPILIKIFYFELYCFEISFQKNGMNSLQETKASFIHPKQKVLVGELRREMVKYHLTKGLPSLSSVEFGLHSKVNEEHASDMMAFAFQKAKSSSRLK